METTGRTSAKQKHSAGKAKASVSCDVRRPTRAVQNSVHCEV
jgi:hypothetical protein